MTDKTWWWIVQCLKEVGKLLDGKVVVGHALKNDFSALMFTPPRHMIRDTAHYRPYMRRKVNGTVRWLVHYRAWCLRSFGMRLTSG